MQDFEMSNLERLLHNRKIKQKRRKKILTVFLVVVFGCLIALMLNYLIKDNNSSQLTPKKINLKVLEAPNYVDVQLIHEGDARTGIKMKEINNIVIHYVGNPNTTAQNNRDYFDKDSTIVCSHFVIGLDGEIIQCVPLNEKSNASNNRNIDTISIEVCHPDKSGKFNEITYNSLVKFTAWLCDNSSLNANDVIRHYDITGKECPKYYVENQDDWEKFINDVRKELENY